MRKILPCIAVLLLVAPSVADAGGQSGTEKSGQEYLQRAEKNIRKHRMSRAELRLRGPSGDPVSPQKVDIRQVNHDFLFGCIAFPLVGKEDELFQRRFKELFNFAILPFYWAHYEQKPGRPGWQEMLPVMEWCEKNDITLKGHPLVWTHPAGVPDWLSGFPKTAREDLLKARVMNTVAGFQGSVEMWDVVNEAVHMRTWNNWDADNYIQEPVDRMADYVEKCFRWAHTANPDATLLLNDFGIMTRESDRQRLIKLVKELRSRDVPLSGLGLQAHEPRYEWFSPPEVWKTLDRLSELGYPVHVTEFIPVSDGQEITGDWQEGKWTEEKQAEYAVKMYKLWFGHPAVQSINWWGLSDRDIWLEGGGLIDEQYEPKPVYRRLQELIHEEWTTEVTLDDMSDEGAASFRGFHGDYRIRVHLDNGQVRTFEKHLGADGPNRWTLRVEE